MASFKLTCKELAKRIGATVVGDETVLLEGIADLQTATAKDVSFFYNEKYRLALKSSKAAAVIGLAADKEAFSGTWLVHLNPSMAFQKAIELFCSKLDTTPYKGIDPSAVIDKSASVDKSATVGPHTVIGPRSCVGARSYVGPGVVIGADVVIGEDCLIHANVTIRESCSLGHRVILQPGAIIGSCGFGYATEDGKHYKLEQMGNVVIEDDVEIGANSCIDRARFKSTLIRRGSKIDNLVMIAHGVEVGEDNMIVAQAGIAGSSKTGRWVVLGGQVGVAGHLNIASQAQVAAQSGITKNLAAGVYGGTPAKPLREWHELQAHLGSIAKLKTKLKELEERLRSLEG